MKLNTSKGNMYSFITHTGNVIKGKCYHDCKYCYMKQWGELPELRLDEKELKTPTKEGNYIFVGSGCDMFAKNVNAEWISETLEYLCKYDNNYLFQTKNPAGFYGFVFPGNSKFCVTIETNRFYTEIMGNSPTPQERVGAILRYGIYKPLITIEPLMDFDLVEFVEMLKDIQPEQVNIGANTSKVKLPEPSKEKLLALIDELQKFTVIHKKTNLKRLLK